MIRTRIARSVARRRTAQSLLRAVARHPKGFQALNRWSMPHAVFDSFEEARSESARLYPASHEDQAIIDGNFALSLQRRSSDYPVLFWLSHIARTRPVRVFDFGGGAGQTFYQYEPLLGSLLGHWTVYELPMLVEQGRKIAAERGAKALRFTDSMRAAADHDVFLALGAIHYWEGSIAELARAHGGLPDHVIISRSPFRAQGSAFITLQTGAHWGVPCLVRNLRETIEEFAALGFATVDQWQVQEKTLHVPLLPDHEAPYEGLYLSRSR
jgi:putative methyltransferase (TIGR04325 family)